MTRLEDDQGRWVEILYEKSKDVTTWVTYDPTTDKGGGGQTGGNQVARIVREYEAKGYRKVQG